MPKLAPTRRIGAVELDRLANPVLQPPRQPLGLAHPAVDQHHQELVAADPHRQVAGAGLVLEDAADLAQDQVAGLVAVGVVDIFEVVEVDADQRDDPAGIDDALIVDLEMAAVGKPGQRIVQRLALDLGGGTGQRVLLRALLR